MDEFLEVPASGLERVEARLLDVTERLETIEALLRRLESASSDMRVSCQNMDGHIGFVEAVMAPFFALRRHVLTSRTMAARYLPCMR